MSEIVLKSDGVNLSKKFIKSEGTDISIFAVGSMVQNSIEAAKFLREKKIFANVINARFIKPLDREFLIQESRTKKLLVTCEEGTLNGGYGSAVAELLADENISTPLLRLGIKDEFIEHGTRAELLELCGLTAKRIADKIVATLEFEDDVKIYEKIRR